MGWFRVESAISEFMSGEWDDALVQIETFFSQLGERQHYMAAPARWVLGRIQAERGQFDQGLRNTNLALEFAHQMRENQLLLPTHASAACILGLAGRTSEASSLIDEYLDAVHEPTSTLGDLVIALALTGREADYAKVPETIRASRWGSAAAAFAARDFAAAADLFAAIGSRYHEAESRSRLGQQLSAEGRAEDAERETASAQTFFRAAGAVLGRGEPDVDRRLAEG